MRLPLLGLLGIGAARLALGGTLGLVEDEAYYWAWSRDLAAGYFDHPPGVAWAIAASERLLGPTPLGVRAGPILLATLAVAPLFARVADRRLFLVLLATTPLFLLGGVLATPDAPLCAGWALALAGAARGGRAGWVVAGLGVGLAGLGKLTGYGLWPLLFLAAPREWRHQALGLLASLVAWAPNLAWNAGHDWVSWRFQLRHGLGDAVVVDPPGLAGLGAFLGAQAGLVGPVVFLAGVAWMLRGPRGDRVDRILWWTSAPTVAFFALAATRATGEVNWAGPAWLGVAAGLARCGGRIARAAWIGAGLGAILTAAVVVHLYHPLVESPRDPARRLGEGRTLARSVEAWGIPAVYTSRYQEAAVIRFYTGLDARALPGVDRPDQYDLWPVHWADRALFVRPAKSGEATHVDRFCRERGDAHLVVEGARRWQVYPVGRCGPAR